MITYHKPNVTRESHHREPFTLFWEGFTYPRTQPLLIKGSVFITTNVLFTAVLTHDKLLRSSTVGNCFYINFSAALKQN